LTDLDGLTPSDRLIQLPALRGLRGQLFPFCARSAKSLHSGSKVRGSCLTHLSFTHSFQPIFCPLLPSRWFPWCLWHAKVHGRVQSPVEWCYPLLHTTLLLCPPSVHSLILRSLVSKLSYSPTLYSKLSSFPTAPPRAVTTRIRRVSG